MWATTESSAPRREAALTAASKGAIATKAPNSAPSKPRARSPIREESDEAIREVLSFLSQVSLSLVSLSLSLPLSPSLILFALGRRRQVCAGCVLGMCWVCAGAAISFSFLDLIKYTSIYA